MEVRKTEFDDLVQYTGDMRAQARKGRIPDYHIDDVVNNAFVVACKGDRTRPPPEERDRVKGWLLELVEWQVDAYWQKIYRQKTSVWTDPSAEGQIVDTREAGQRLEAHQWVRLALKRLPEKCAYVVFERLGFGTHIRDLAREMGVSESTVGSWFHRGEKQLREALVATNDPKRRRRRLCIPFLPDVRDLWRALVRRFGRLGMSFATGGAVLFFPTSTPDGCGLDQAASEPKAIATASANTPGHEPARIEGRIWRVVPEAPVDAKALPRMTSTADSRAVAFGARSAGGGILTLVDANAALVQGNPEKAKTLLDADIEERPDAQEKRERAILRAAADRK